MREPVESTTMRSIGYEAAGQMLEIEFESGAVYRYLGVPGEVFEQLRQAESKGRYFNAAIRDCYEWERGGQRAAGAAS